jgi:hypothetical protein
VTTPYAALTFDAPLTPDGPLTFDGPPTFYAAMTLDAISLYGGYPLEGSERA